MSDYTSFAPSAIAQRPWDAVAGVDASRQDEVARQAQEMDLANMLTRNQQRQAELQRYQGMNPGEISKSQLEGYLADAKRSTPGYGAAMTAGDMGDAQSKSAKGAYDMYTMPSKGRADAAKNEAQEFEQAAQHFNNHVPLIKAAYEESPLAGQMAYTQFRKGLPEHAREIFPEQYSPEIQQKMDVVMKNIINNPQHQREMEKDLQQRETQLQVGRGNNYATMYAAEQRAKGRIRNLMEQFQGAKTPEMVSVIGKIILADPEIDPITANAVREGITKADRIIAEKTGKGGIDLKNPTDAAAVPDAINRRLSADGQPTEKRHTMNELKQLYPGRTDQWIKDAYKKKFGYEPL